MIPTDYNEKRKISRVVNNVPLPEATRLTLEDLQWNNGSHVDLRRLKEHLRAEGKLSLPSAMAIAQRAAMLFHDEKNVLELKAPVTMFGDIHGQYLDLIDRTDSLPDPTPTDTWLFLGDYVDRGCFGVEVVLYLFSLKINYPNAVYLIRGNHECRHLTNAYNFRKECLGKYKSLEFYDQIMETFDNLPLAAVVDGGNGHNFLCIHGGLSPDIKTIQDINNLNRFCEPPQSGPMCDLLWSDPLEDDTAANLQPNEMDEWYAVEFFENENRGAGYIFGYTAVMDFLTTNNLSTIIRAHDVQRTGYSQLFMHCKEKTRRLPLVITVFSAPNYCGYYGNDAAILRLEPAIKEGNPFTELETSQNFLATSQLSDICEKSEETDFTEPEDLEKSETDLDEFSQKGNSENPELRQSEKIPNMDNPEIVISWEGNSTNQKEECSNKQEEGLSTNEEEGRSTNQKEGRSTNQDEEQKLSDDENPEIILENSGSSVITKSFENSSDLEEGDWEVETVPPPDLAADYFPRLIFTTYNWVLEVPFWLPTFENAFQYSIPLVTDKIQDFLSSINSVPIDEEPPLRPSPSFVISPPSPVIDPFAAAAAKAAVAVIEPVVIPPFPSPPRRPFFIDVSDWQITRASVSDISLPQNRRVSDHIRSFESKRHPTVLTSGDAMKRRKSVKALSGSFQNKFRSYLTVINSRFDQIKKDNRTSELRPPMN